MLQVSFMVYFSNIWLQFAVVQFPQIIRSDHIIMVDYITMLFFFRFRVPGSFSRMPCMNDIMQIY